jgi:hypothetical protein
VTYRLVALPEVPDWFDREILFDADAHRACEFIFDWGDCERRHFLIERAEGESNDTDN